MAPSSAASPKAVPHRRGWRRRLVSHGFLFAAGYVAWCAILFFKQDAMIFPRELAGRPVEATGPNVERVWIDAADGVRVEAWYLTPRPALPGPPAAAVIFAHGNAELIDDSLTSVATYNAWGLAVLLPEYRGYGRSGGVPSEEAIVADSARFHDWLAARPDVDRTRIIFHGRSLGGGVAAALAARRRPAALILESTFTSVASFASGYGVPAFLCRHPFRTDLVLAGLDRPVLIFHGTDDTIVPVAHGRRLHELAPSAEYHEMRCGHNEFPCDPAAYWAIIRAFLEKHGLLPGGARS